jgi:soluble lytic murein transglycosylase
MSAVPLRRAVKILYWNAMVALLVVGLGWSAWLRRIHRYDARIEEVGRAQGVDPRLLSAVIWKESRYRAWATGARGEIGLMQVTPAAAAEWARAEKREAPSRADLFDVDTNLNAGAWYLARAIRRWSDRGDPLPFALAEYNAGPENARRWALDAATPEAFWKGITYPTTRRYVHDILRRYRRKAF